MKCDIKNMQPKIKVLLMYLLYVYFVYTILILIFFKKCLAKAPIILNDINKNNESLYYQLHDLGLSCLKQSNSTYGYHDIPYHTREERNIEYRRILNLTVESRKYPTHSWLGFDGPWIEDIWISTFCCTKDISEFGPYIPVFVPWLNIYKK